MFYLLSFSKTAEFEIIHHTTDNVTTDMSKLSSPDRDLPRPSASVSVNTHTGRTTGTTQQRQQPCRQWDDNNNGG